MRTIYRNALRFSEQQQQEIKQFKQFKQFKHKLDGQITKILAISVMTTSKSKINNLLAYQV